MEKLGASPMEQSRPWTGGYHVPVGYSSKQLTIPQMSDLIELIHMFGARHGVEFREPK